MGRVVGEETPHPLQRLKSTRSLDLLLINWLRPRHYHERPGRIFLHPCMLGVHDHCLD